MGTRSPADTENKTSSLRIIARYPRQRYDAPLRVILTLTNERRKKIHDARKIHRPSRWNATVRTADRWGIRLYPRRSRRHRFITEIEVSANRSTLELPSRSISNDPSRLLEERTRLFWIIRSADRLMKICIEIHRADRSVVPVTRGRLVFTWSSISKRFCVYRSMPQVFTADRSTG